MVPNQALVYSQTSPTDIQISIRSLNMINSRSLSDLDPEAEAVAEAHISACLEEGIELLITSTYRDYESQDALYAIGRSVLSPG